MNSRVPHGPTRRPLLVLHDCDCLSYHAANIIQGSGTCISPKFPMTPPSTKQNQPKIAHPALEQWRGKRLFVSITASEGSASTWNSHWKSSHKSYWMASF
jgi:hypothetical protein